MTSRYAYQIIFVLLLILSLTTQYFAQVYNGNVILNTQLEVNDFGTNKYTEITGHLFIEENIDGSIIDLIPLSTITTVGGYIVVQSNSSLPNLNGLTNISFVGEDLNINSNSSLTSISGLINIGSIGGNLYVWDNPLLASLDGINNISTVNGTLILGLIPSIENLEGLNKITTVDGDLFIFENVALRNLDGINITSVGGNIDISNNSSLINLDGLTNIISASGDLIVENNNILFSFCALFKLLSTGGLGGTFEVSGNLIDPTINDIIDDGPCNIFTGDVNITSQTDVDNFNYTSIYGNLNIEESINGNITDLAPLSKLTYISGQLRLWYNQDITNLNGLKNVRYVGNDLWVQGHYLLTNIEGLSNIFYVGGNLAISQNFALTSIDPLNNITTVKSLFIHKNSISNLDGLSNIITVDGDLYITYNVGLINFCGLEQLLLSDGLSGNYYVKYNTTNPTQQEILDNCGTIAVNAKINLEGPYSTATNNMNNILIVSLESPYLEDPQSVDLIPPNVVDWVLLELRSVSDNRVVVASRSVFVLTDGTIVDLDGASPVVFHKPNIRYYLAVKHRNHLAVLSSCEIND